MNKNLRFNRIDTISVFILAVLLLVTILLYGSVYRNKSYLTLSKMSCDYIYALNSENEYNELANSSNIDKIVPYYYFLPSVNENSSADLYVINDKTDVDYTTFSNELLIKKSNSEFDNELYIDEKAAKYYKLSLNDEVQLSFANTTIKYHVTRIYKTDERSTTGSIMTFNLSETGNAIESYYQGAKKYKGAYVVSSNHNALKDEFAFEKVDVNELLSKREIAVKGNLVGSIVLVIVVSTFSILGIGAYILIKQKLYIKKNLSIDFNSKYTLESELKMFSRFNLTFLVLTLCIACLMLLLPIIGDGVKEYFIRSFVFSWRYLVVIMAIICFECIDYLIIHKNVKSFYNKK